MEVKQSISKREKILFHKFRPSRIQKFIVFRESNVKVLPPNTCQLARKTGSWADPAKFNTHQQPVACTDPLQPQSRPLQTQKYFSFQIDILVKINSPQKCGSFRKKAYNNNLFYLELFVLVVLMSLIPWRKIVVIELRIIKNLLAANCHILPY